MKSDTFKKHIFILLLPFLFTGCYTQFQTADRFPIEDDRYAGYYAWDGFEESQEDNRNQQTTSSYNANNDYEYDYLEDEYALEEAGIYYKDYETERWYQENNADKYYWLGYEDGYVDGYDDGRSNYYMYNNAYHYPSLAQRTHFMLWLDFYVGGIGFSPWFNYSHYYASPHWIGYSHYGWNYYGYNYYSYPTYGWGYYNWGYYGSYPYHNTYVTVYNNYHKTKKYSRVADLYRKGPRGSGLINNGNTRSRSGINKSGNSTVRNRTGTTNSRVRSTGRSVNGRSSTKVGRTRSTGRSSSVGKSRSTGGSSRNTGRSSSVGKKRSSSGNNGSSSGTKSRSRSGGDNLSSASSYSSSNSKTRTVTNRSYSIPVKLSTSNINLNRSVDEKKMRSRIISRINNNRSSTTSFKTKFRSNRSTSSSKFNRSPVRSSSSKTRVIKRTSNSRSSSARVSRSSSSSSRSSANTSKKSSSSKRSRGGGN